MDESILDGILTKLSKNGTDKIEATDEFLKKVNLHNTSPIHSVELEFLVNQGYLHREVTPYFEHPPGVFNPARYYIRLTPKGLKFISEGGYTAKSSYTRRTLTVATQSRNWAITAVAVAVVALGMQLYFANRPEPATKPGTDTDNVILLKDSIPRNGDTLKRDLPKTDTAPIILPSKKSLKKSSAQPLKEKADTISRQQIF